MVLEKSREKITELGHRLKERTTELGKKINEHLPGRKKKVTVNVVKETGQSKNIGSEQKEFSKSKRAGKHFFSPIINRFRKEK